MRCGKYYDSMKDAEKDGVATRTNALWQIRVAGDETVVGKVATRTNALWQS